MPRLYVTPDPQPNASATGRSPRHAAVAVPRGLLDLLTPQELEAVLAHELAHRSREFAADRTGADLVGSGRPLATALAEIEHAARRIPMQVPPALAPQYVVHPLTGAGTLATLFRTHPPTAERITRLTSGRVR